MLGSQQIIIAAGQEWTAWKDIVRDGGIAPATLPTFPLAPATPPAAVAPGILGRFQALVRRVKSAPGYTQAIGEALNIVGADHAAPDPATTAPDLELSLNGGSVQIGWKKAGFDAIEIEVDRGTGTFTLFTIDTSPDTLDTAPAPTGATLWRYRAIYREANARFGQWSKVATIALGS